MYERKHPKNYDDYLYLGVLIKEARASVGDFASAVYGMYARNHEERKAAEKLLKDMGKLRKTLLIEAIADQASNPLRPKSGSFAPPPGMPEDPFYGIDLEGCKEYLRAKGYKL